MASWRISDWLERRQQPRRADSRRLHLEELECRSLLSVTGGITSAVNPDVWITPSMLAAVASQPAQAAAASTQVSSVKMDPVGRVVTEPPVRTPGGLSNFSGGVTPGHMQAAYGSNRSGFDGSGETIGIVEETAVPFQTLVDALNNFDHTLQVFGPAFNFTAYVAPGTQSAADSGVGVETLLDLEWAHVMAPAANIYLAEFPFSVTQPLSGVINAASYLASQGIPVISMSYGLDEATNSADGDMALGESVFTKFPNTAFIVSSGDQKSGEAFDYPASSPNVIAVGGTQFLNVDNPVGGQELPWAGPGFGAGGGVSSFFTEPSYQTAVFTGTGRGVPDVSMDASDAWEYDPFDSPFAPWFTVGGTSLAAPMFAALIADTDQGRAQAGEGPISTSQLHTSLYAIGAGPTDTSVFNDITQGNNNFFSATQGYDLATGLGTPKAAALENALIGTLAAPAQNGPSGVVQTTAPTFSWSAVPGATEYQLTIVDQATGKNVTTPVLLTGTSYTAPSGVLSAGHAYSWSVTAMTSLGTGAASANLAFSTQLATAPAAPTLAAAAASSSQVNLNWSAVGASSYNLYEFENGAPVLIGSYPASVTSTTVNGLSAGTSYAFDLVAFTGLGPKATAWVGATTIRSSDTVHPATPTLVATPISSSQVTLNWSATGATTFSLYEFENGAPVLIGSYPASVTSVTISGLKPGTSYAFNLVANTILGPTASSWVGASTNAASSSASALAAATSKPASSSTSTPSANPVKATATVSLGSSLSRLPLRND